uniref:Uncharacterized protein n=1 Tax=Parascaris equorum TaxID=6256 RepID=A0A914S0A3_PAREQ
MDLEDCSLITDATLENLSKGCPRLVNLSRFACSPGQLERILRCIFPLSGTFNHSVCCYLDFTAVYSCGYWLIMGVIS